MKQIVPTICQVTNEAMLEISFCFLVNAGTKIIACVNTS